MKLTWIEMPNRPTEVADALGVVMSIAASFGSAAMFAGIVGDLAAEPDVGAVGRRIVGVAATVTDCSGVVLVRVGPGGRGQRPRRDYGRPRRDRLPPCSCCCSDCLGTGRGRPCGRVDR